jgi:hypothetical protein
MTYADEFDDLAASTIDHPAFRPSEEEWRKARDLTAKRTKEDAENLLKLFGEGRITLYALEHTATLRQAGVDSVTAHRLTDNKFGETATERFQRGYRQKG